MDIFLNILFKSLMETLIHPDPGGIPCDATPKISGKLLGILEGDQLFTT